MCVCAHTHARHLIMILGSERHAIKLRIGRHLIVVMGSKRHTVKLRIGRHLIAEIGRH